MRHNRDQDTNADNDSFKAAEQYNALGSEDPSETYVSGSERAYLSARSKDSREVIANEHDKASAELYARADELEQAGRTDAAESTRMSAQYHERMAKEARDITGSDSKWGGDNLDRVHPDKAA